MKPVFRVIIALGLLTGSASASTQFPIGYSPLLKSPAIDMAQIGSPPREKKPESEPEPAAAGPTVINPKVAMLYSFLLPGLGQQMAGRPARARVFYAVEAGIWTSFVAFRLQGSARHDRFVEFARFAGGVDPSGKGDDYWRTVAQFERSDPGPFSANEFVRRQARALYPGNLEAQQSYFEQNGYFGNRTWDWQNADNLARFQDLRSRSIDSYDRSELSIAAAIAHRLLSMIDAARVASSANRNARDKAADDSRLAPRLGMRMMRDGDDRVPVLTLKTSF